VKTLTFYELAGIVIPGAVLLFAVAALVPSLKGLLGGDGITVGGLGVFLILSYAAGHAVAAVGNLLESVLWRLMGGMPTDWITHDPPKLVTSQQLDVFKGRFKERFGYEPPPVRRLPRQQWAPVYGQVYRDVLACNPGRVETFNGNYGLNRGMAASLLCVSAAIGIAQPPRAGWLALGAGFLALVFLYRAYRFGVHFAKEVYYCFLNPRPAKATAPDAAGLV
jgi:hypothetical protein